MMQTVRSVSRNMVAARRMFATAQTSHVTYNDMKKTKHDFVHFVNTAIKDKSSPEARELYHYLNKCFVDNDTDYDGLVSYRGFNSMIAEAAVAPRRFGFAPHTREMYKSAEDFDLARTELFNQLKSTNKRITYESWVNWAMNHINEKVGSGLEEHTDCKWERSKEDCIQFFKMVFKQGSSHNMKSSTSTQFKEFYMLMNDMFIDHDTSLTGKLNKADFEKLVANCDKIPGKFGMQWYKNVSYDGVKEGGVVGWKQFLHMSLETVKKGAASA